VLEGDEKDDRDRELHFMLSQNDSVVTDFSDFRLPVDGKSIVGAAVLTRQPINLPDLYGLEFSTNPFGFKHDRSFDERIHYQTRSMLTVPMLDAHDDVIGVIQLINKKREPDTKLTQPSDFNTNVIPFDAASEKLALALATPAFRSRMRCSMPKSASCSRGSCTRASSPSSRAIRRPAATRSAWAR